MYCLREAHVLMNATLAHNPDHPLNKSVIQAVSYTSAGVGAAQMDYAELQKQKCPAVCVDP